jgi:hypothetical protein
MQEYESRPGGAVGISEFRHVGDASLGCSFKTRMPAGAVYHLSARTLHRITTVDDHCTATLFLQGPIQQPSTTVMSDRPARRRPTIVRPTMSPDALDERVRSYLRNAPGGRAA